MTKDNMRELLEDGSTGLDLSPGNDLYKKAHDEIIALRADLQALAVAAQALWDEDYLNLGPEVDAMKEALSRPGVKAVLDQATSRAADTSDV